VLDLVKRLAEQVSQSCSCRTTCTTSSRSPTGSRCCASAETSRFNTKDTTRREVVEAITAVKRSTVPGQEAEARDLAPSPECGTRPIRTEVLAMSAITPPLPTPADAPSATIGAYARRWAENVRGGRLGSLPTFLELDPEQLELMIDVNLKGVMYTARAAAAATGRGGGGDFVSLASAAGVSAFSGEAVYSASKFGRVGFTRALDLELREHGVRCTSICPGSVATGFAIGTGRTVDMLERAEMTSGGGVADVVMFALTRPRSMRLMTTTFRPMGEASWG
jgi:hypothetical protein